MTVYPNDHCCPYYEDFDLHSNRVGGEGRSEPAYPSYVLTSFRSGRHIVPCWLVGCTTSWMWIQRLNNCYLLHMLLYISSSVNVCHSLFWRFCSESTSLLLCWYALTCMPVFSRRILFVTFWLAEVARVIVSPEVPIASKPYMPEASSHVCMRDFVSFQGKT